MRIIDMEGHFYTHDYAEHLRKRKSFPRVVSDGPTIKVYHNKNLFSPEESRSRKLFSTWEKAG